MRRHRSGQWEYIEATPRGKGGSVPDSAGINQEEYCHMELMPSANSHSSRYQPTQAYQERVKWIELNNRSCLPNFRSNTREIRAALPTKKNVTALTRRKAFGLKVGRVKSGCVRRAATNNPGAHETKVWSCVIETERTWRYSSRRLLEICGLGADGESLGAVYRKPDNTSRFHSGAVDNYLRVFDSNPVGKGSAWPRPMVMVGNDTRGVTGSNTSRSSRGEYSSQPPRTSCGGGKGSDLDQCSEEVEQRHGRLEQMVVVVKRDIGQQSGEIVYREKLGQGGSGRLVSLPLNIATTNPFNTGDSYTPVSVVLSTHSMRGTDGPVPQAHVTELSGSTVLQSTTREVKRVGFPELLPV